MAAQGRPKNEEETPAAPRSDPAGRQAGRRLHTSQPRAAQFGGASTSHGDLTPREASTSHGVTTPRDASSSHGVITPRDASTSYSVLTPRDASSSHGVITPRDASTSHGVLTPRDASISHGILTPRGASTTHGVARMALRAPPAPERHPTQQQSDPPSEARGAGDGAARNPRQEMAKKFDEMKKYLQRHPDGRLTSINNRTYALVIEALEVDTKAAAQRSSSEQRDMGQKVCFNFQMTRFSLRPKNQGHSSTVAKTLFTRQVQTAQFFAPEFGGPWAFQRQPKWTLDQNYASRPNEELFRLISPTYAPSTYPSWRENIRAAWLLLNTQYQVRSSRSSTSTTPITIKNLRNLDNTEDPFSFKNMQHIAQAIIYFEDALQTLLPGAPEQRRNWRDNEALRHKSRPDAITAIGKARNLYQLSELFCSSSVDGWCWYFFENLEVIWVQPGASEKADTLIENVEHLLPFIEACLTLRSPTQLQPYYPDLAGLQSFSLNSLVFKPLSRPATGRVTRRLQDKRLFPQPCLVPDTAFSGPRR